MTEEQPACEPAQPEKRIQLSQLLENVSPGQICEIRTGLISVEAKDPSGRPTRFLLTLPEIQLHCPSDVCNGERIYRPDDDEDLLRIRDQDWVFEYVNYKCSNCQDQIKTFALAVRIQAGAQTSATAHCYKLGEHPPYGPPTPSRLISLLGPGRDLFLKGRRCENQGLGIGAFVYYRRVVEGQKKRILAEIIKVAQTISAPPEAIAALQAAQREHQFSKAMDDVKDAIPQRLLIQGQNPLTLLHSALSKGVHNHSDETCLGLATDIRLVLGELAELLGHALKDER